MRSECTEEPESKSSLELLSARATLAVALVFVDCSLTLVFFVAESVLAFSCLSFRQSATSCPSMSQWLQCCLDLSTLDLSDWSPFGLFCCLPFHASLHAFAKKAAASEPEWLILCCSSSMICDLTSAETKVAVFPRIVWRVYRLLGSALIRVMVVVTNPGFRTKSR